MLTAIFLITRKWHKVDESLMFLTVMFDTIVVVLLFGIWEK